VIGVDGEMSGLRRKILGAVLVLVLVAISVGVVGGYLKWFTPALRATVNAERAGLLMNVGAPVNLRGIKVGDVRAVRPGARGAALDIAIDPDQVRYIPANVTASIGVPTLFGAKYLELGIPAQPSGARIDEGAQIATTAVVTEGNTLLDNLDKLLASVDVAKLNSALGAVSTGLQGRGDRIGNLVVQVNDYLKKFNPSVPQLAQDLSVAAPVTSTYAQATPPLVRALDNLSATSDTLVSQEQGIEKLLSHVTEVSDDGHKLLDDSGDQLVDLVRTLRPTSELLDKYSPMFPCLFASVNQVRIDLERIIGGQYPGVHTLTSFLPASAAYRNPRDLPVVGPKIPPTCFGGPLRPGDNPFPHVIFNDGGHDFALGDSVIPPGNQPPATSPLSNKMSTSLEVPHALSPPLPDSRGLPDSRVGGLPR
jgi:phospholipid/cholesterol/gamma-HCH transport system substrate-binding protein